MLRFVRSVGAVLLLGAIALAGACIYQAHDAQHWVETVRSPDGSYTRIKIIHGVYDQEIRYRADGTKEFHCYTDSSNAIHHVSYDADGEVTNHEVIR